MRNIATPDKQAMPLISEAEMALLLTPQERKLLKGVDKGFLLRNLFLLASVLFFAIRLLFFSEQTYLGLNIHTDVRDLRPYLQYRGIFILLASAVYVLSYARDWYFERVALFSCAISFTGLLMDFFNIYSLIQGPMPTHVLALIFLRAACTYVLLINAIRADRAPPLPRGLWR
jgi:hypothetical protein